MKPRILNPRAAADPVAYMDAVRESESGRRYKRAALELLSLRPGHRVLDLGCGPGDDARRFAECVAPSGRVVAIDRHDVMIEAAVSRHGSVANLEFATRDASQLPDPDESFDRIYADRVVQLLGERRLPVFRELLRVLRPGGHLVCCSPDAGSFAIDIGERRITAKIAAHLGGRGWQGRELPNLLRDMGFADLQLTARTSWETDFETIDATTPLESLARWVCEAGAISETERTQWVERLREAVAQDRFAFASTMLIARGTRPQSE
jgi:SAM-dependent methyltransferase